MDYEYQYYKLIKKSKENENFIIQDYFETHHIKPICMGGSNKKQNLVKLTAKAHFVAHHLLCKIYPNDYKLASAFNLMCCHTNNNRIKRLNCRLFENARKHYSNNHPMKNLHILEKHRIGIKKYWDEKGHKKVSDRWIKFYTDNKIDHIEDFPMCMRCKSKCNYRGSKFCCKDCFDAYQSDNFYRSPESHKKMVLAIKNSINSLSEDDKKKRLEKSLHSSKVDHIKRGKNISKSKKGKKTNQYEIMGRRFVGMSDNDFDTYLKDKSKMIKSRMINLRNKWKNILQ